MNKAVTGMVKIDIKFFNRVAKSENKKTQAHLNKFAVDINNILKDIKDNKVYIYTDSSDNVYKYFFTVYGERKDVERLEVEID